MTASDARAATVYIVDDDDAVRESLTLLLEAAQFAVRAYDSCAAFLAAQIERANACLLLDLYMPSMSGYDLLEQRPAALHDLPVIVISGKADWAGKTRALAAGALTVLEKPCREQDLLGAIRQALGPAHGGA
jgi:FixJ family two-component response regulator